MSSLSLKNLFDANVNVQQQYLTLHESAGIVDLNDEEIYALSGEDRKNFLNSYNTQDIKTLKEYQSTYGAFLTQKGKLVSDSFVLCLPDKVLLLLQSGYGIKLQQHLATYLMFSNVRLEDESAQWGHVALIGTKAASILREALTVELPVETKELKFQEFQEKPLFIFQSTRLGLPAWEVLTVRENMLSLAEKLKNVGAVREPPLPLVRKETLEIIRVEAGIPKMGIDMNEDNLVAEVGLDTSATSFNKGCYLGQEITARVQSRGHVNKKLMQWKLVGKQHAVPPLDIFQGDKTIGQLTSIVASPKWNGYIGLGIIHLQALESSEKFYTKTPEGNIELEKIP